MIKKNIFNCRISIMKKNFSRKLLTVINFLDVNECDLNDTCSANATCINLEGSYTCKCKDGFKDSDPTNPGRQCEGIISFKCYYKSVIIKSSRKKVLKLFLRINFKSLQMLIVMLIFFIPSTKVFITVINKNCWCSWSKSQNIFF